VSARPEPYDEAACGPRVVPVWILYKDALLGRKAFAGPYVSSPLVEAEARRLWTDGNNDVEIIRARAIGPWMPPLRFTGADRLGCTAAEALKGDDGSGELSVAGGWDAVERAFPGQRVEAVSSDGEELRGEVSGIDLARRRILIRIY
jgi:hypothetical protein